MKLVKPKVIFADDYKLEAEDAAVVFTKSGELKVIYPASADGNNNGMPDHELNASIASTLFHIANRDLYKEVSERFFEAYRQAVKQKQEQVQEPNQTRH
jgi:hypothetical protein